VLSVFLACDNPYETAEQMTTQLGWHLEFATPADSGDQLACVSLAGAQVMLGTAEEQYLAATSRDHRGAGVTVYVSLPPDTDIAAVAARHAAGGVMTRPLTERPWGGLAFDAVIAGYRFLISQPAGDAAPR
jgi:uncharacterized glyoxalase superfamily protein PhnB